jgi:hypothetical protein
MYPFGGEIVLHSPYFRQLAQCTFQQGNSILLWQDAWSQQPLRDTWPHLYYCINETISLQQALILPDAADLFHLPLSEEALAQFHLFQALLLSLVPSQNNENVDSWTIFQKADTLMVSSVYKSFMNSGGAILAFKWMWKSCCQQKHKVFFWLLLHNRLNTKAILQRNNFFMDD